MTMTTDGRYSIGSDHFPGLSKLVEETGELQQVLGKILGCGTLDHWDGDLTERLIAELGDVRAAIRFFEDKNLDHMQRIKVYRREAAKLAVFNDWHDIGDPPPERGSTS